ncbi:MAG: M28 family metallopeptidase [Chloroflexi bacterium]|nr:M28 family metallopeptidase [Chloroflexota bacterium]
MPTTFRLPPWSKPSRVLVGAAILATVLFVACASATATPAPPATSTPEPTLAPTPAALNPPEPTPSPTPKFFTPEPELSGAGPFAELERFLDESGPRESATDQELAAAEYLKSRFRDMGYRTELQPFTVEDVSLAGNGLTLNTPSPETIPARPLTNSGLGDVSGILTPVGLALPGDIPEAGLKGRIALAERGQITFQSKADNVFAAGAVGLVIYNNRPGVFQGVLASQPGFPVISLSQEDGKAIEVRLAESKIEASIDVSLVDRPSRNVIAEKQGPGDAVVVLGGHYDTVPGIVGANDNASGIAVLLSIAQTLAAADLPFTLRIIPFGSEELGLLGSEFYVASLSDTELASTKAMLNIDAVGTGNGVSISGHPALTGLASQILAEAGMEFSVTGEVAGATSDHASFQAAGVPYITFYGDGLSRIHTDGDTIGAVQPGLLENAAKVAVAILRSDAFFYLITPE